MTRRVKTHISLGLRSVSLSDQSPRCPHEETLGSSVPIAKFRGVSQRNVTEFLCKLSRSFSAKTLGEISNFYFSLQKKFISRKGCSTAKREKRAFFLG